MQQDGPDAFFEGPMAESIARDLAAVGSRVTMRDLAEISASIGEPISTPYRDATVHVAGHLAAGPSSPRRWGYSEAKLNPSHDAPGVDAYRAYAESLLETYEWRLSHLGEGPQAPTNTSHVCAVDRDGNVVSLTQSIMSAFGSRIMLPDTGIIMNNGMMWFDPRPGNPNSVAAGRQPLCNMCPTIIEQADGSLTALGACGGRKIFPAVFQLASFIIDYAMSIDAAVHCPRLDNSGTDMITLMDSMAPDVVAALAEEFRKRAFAPMALHPTCSPCRNSQGGVPMATVKAAASSRHPTPASPSRTEPG
ncbi:MAG: gamma-glutamyltransferase [Gammaproteobacteria bacterium]|nr:gamma-glutamyltransferase [Gammaproteobacteria bacterium]